jgi:hypothetical protein
VVHPDVIEHVQPKIRRMKWKYFVLGTVSGEEEMRLDEFRVFGGGEDITDSYSTEEPSAGEPAA